VPEGQREFLEAAVMSPEHKLVACKLARKPTGFYAVSYVPTVSGSYYCQLYDNGNEISSRPFEILVTENEIATLASRPHAKTGSASPSTPRIAFTPAPNPSEDVEFNFHQKKPTVQPCVLLENSLADSGLCTPDQLILDCRSPSGVTVNAKAYQIPVIGEEAGAYFIQFSTESETGLYSLQIFSDEGEPLFDEALQFCVDKKNQLIMISLNLPLTPEQLELELLSLLKKEEEDFDAKITGLSEGLLLIQMNDVLSREKRKQENGTVRLAEFQLTHKGSPVFSESYLITV
jgi:hypothetical protein